MKKIFTLFFALFLMAFCAKAQFLLQEGFESATLPTGWTIIDNDGDGFNWFPTMSTTENYSYHSGSGCITSASWDSDEGALTPDNWLITPAINLTSNATLTFWVVGQDPDYAEENYSVYVATSNTVAAFTATTAVLTGVSTDTYTQKSVDLSAYTGQTVYIAFRHHITSDMYMLNIDDVEIFALPTNPTITVVPTAIDFGTISMPGNSVSTANITAYNLTAGITATTAAPFEVSADSTTYGTTATIAQAGGTLYVRYSPTTAGTDSGTVTLSSTGANNVTISLTGSGLDCSNIPWPYTCNFDNDAVIQCWTTVDVDTNGTGTYGEFVFSTESGYAAYGYLANAPANDWLISPILNVPATGGVASFDYRVAGSSYPEKYSVYVITTGQTYANATQVVPTQTVTNTDWGTQYVNLSSYAGTAVQIGIKVESDADMFRLYITNFTVNDDVAASFDVTPTEIDFGSVSIGNPYYATAIIHSVNVNEAFTLTTTSPYSISLDGTSYATTATIPANPALSVEDTIYIKYEPTVEGSDNAIIQITSTTYTDTITLSGVAVDCSGGIESLPFTYTFDDRIVPPTCWGYNDPNNFLVVNIDTTTQDFGIAIGGLDYLITPEIHSTSAMHLSFDYAHYLSTYASSTFRVGYSSTTDELNSFTWIDNITVNDGNGFTTYTSILPAGTKYVAFEVTALGSYIFYSDYIFLNNITLTEASSAEIYTATTNIDFGTVSINATSVNTINITGVALTTDITATTTAPFEVSADNSTFGATATIPAAGGNLYVRYAPTTAGAHTGNVTLASTGATSVTISLSGNAVDCSSAASLPFFEGFESELNECWTLIDNDGDGYNWHVLNNSQSQEGGFVVHSGEGHITSASWSQAALTPDNWLITPAINLSENATLSFWVAGQDPSYAAENFSVYLSTTGTDINNFNITLLENQTSTAEMTEFTADLSAYTGNNVHIAFRHHNVTDMFRLNLDDVSVTAGVGIKNAESGNVTVYPNPAYNYINVNATSNINNVEVYTIAGQKVGDFTANGTQTVISTANLSNGMYMMRINTENGVINKKFSVVR